jgi:predicted transcriptional regulator
MYSELISSGTEVSIVISSHLIEKLKTDSHSDLEALLNMDRLHLYLYKKPVSLIYFAQNDHYLLFSLLKNDGEIDNKLVRCGGSSALGWGKELFDNYLQDSASITQI